MTDFRFAEPGWVHALWVLLAFGALLVWLERRGGSALERLVSSRLQELLVQRPARGSRRAGLALIGLAGVFSILALMRPQWGLHYVAASRFGAEIMVCLDVSRSMLAEDVAPNRLERAKAEIRDLLPLLDGDSVGLIAFAGRASVLSPLTPDFGFLRLVLDGAGVDSVTRGGTRLEEPIRKAVRGFGPAGDLSRVILLITDGEDHDSFPLDAAREAAEAGVRIIAIGIGDEAGSQVMVTDPGTGARTLLRDARGDPVTTRLDGETLRRIALATGGAYVPAGTGILDLESIYSTHMAPLERGALQARGKAVRYDGYQWAVLLALVCLVLAAGVAGRAWRPVPRPSSGFRAGPALLLLAALAIAPRAPAAPVPAQPPPSPGAPEKQEEEQEKSPPGPPAKPAEAPRETYNRGLRALREGRFEEAEPLLTQARSAAGADGELRYRATYNLGVAAAKSADLALEKSPEKALERLRIAAGWLREAVRLRPGAEDPRHDLEIVLQHTLALADSLARRDPGDWGRALAELARQQRGLVARLRDRMEQMADAPAPGPDDELRRALRGLATTQRAALSDADALASRVGEERDALEKQPQEERAPEDRVRRVQLENLLHYLHRARERMGQARSRLRERQAERAYRRASAALRELRRGQDQLAGPTQVLDAILREATELAIGTALLARGQASLPAAEPPPGPPAWLTPEVLREAQESVSGRTDELHARLAAGLGADAGQAPETGTGRILDMARDAEPLVARARDSFTRADLALAEEDLASAGAAQREGIQALLDARERFLDLRGLIETAYADERRIGAALEAGDEKAESPVPIEEMLPALREIQARNLERTRRLGKLLEEEKPPPGGGEETPEQQEKARQRLALAGQLLEAVREAMHQARTALEAPGEGSASAGDLVAAGEAVHHATEGLEALRRLFFSIVEHLRETAARQLEVNDDTQDAAALLARDPDSARQKLGPLIPRQEKLAKIAEEIANALDQQSRRSASVPSQDPNLPPATEPDTEQVARQLRRAGELVLEAQDDMAGAASGMRADPPGLGPAREQQDSAVARLQEAISLLAPPAAQPRKPEAGQEKPRTASSQEGGAKKSQQAAREAAADPAQILQAVRDRAARRQHERQARGSSGYRSVEKDW